MPEDTYRLIVAEYGEDNGKYESVFFGKCSEKNGIITIDGRKARMSDVNNKYNELRDKLWSQETDRGLLKIYAAFDVFKSEDQKVFVIQPDDILKDDVLRNRKYDEKDAKIITDFFKSEIDEEYPEYLKRLSENK